MDDAVWESPDSKIRKQIITRGISELNPTEDCQCTIKISSCSSVEIDKYSSLSTVIIGDCNSSFERLLHNCLMKMKTGEVSKVIFRKTEEHFVLELISCESNGQIYEWNASQKLSLAVRHKAKGIELYGEAQYIDASHRFGKGLKILCSIPIEVDECPDEIDGVKVSDIQVLKAVLYNNLASCYLKHCDFETVLQLCEKVLEIDNSNVKALYKRAVAKCETLDYEGSQENFLQILEVDPTNKAAAEKLKHVNAKITESNAKVNAIFKRMFN